MRMRHRTEKKKLWSSYFERKYPGEKVSAARTSEDYLCAPEESEDEKRKYVLEHINVSPFVQMVQ